MLRNIELGVTMEVTNIKTVATTTPVKGRSTRLITNTAKEARRSRLEKRKKSS